MTKTPRIYDHVERVSISLLREDPNNTRNHSAKQIATLKNGISRLGFLRALLVDANNMIVSGHARYRAAKELGMTELPVTRLSDHSKAELRAIALAENRIAELATWDQPALRHEFEELLAQDLDFDLSEMTGFEPAYIDATVHGDDFGTEAQDPADAMAPPAPAEITEVGDVFRIGDLQLACADALNPASYRALLGNAKAAACITDPPFNVRINGHVSGKGKRQHREFVQGSGELSKAQYDSFLETFLDRTANACCDGALIYAFMDGAHLLALLSAAERLGLDQKAIVTWNKTNAGMGGLYRQQTEFICVFKSGAGASCNNVQLGRFGRNRTTLWSYPGMNAFGRGRDQALALHPTVKPVAMLADAILDCTNRGDIVLDPFAGSASTLIAAHRTGRIGMGMELDPLYVDASLARLKAVTGIEPIRERDGATWSELVAAATAP